MCFAHFSYDLYAVDVRTVHENEKLYLELHEIEKSIHEKQNYFWCGDKKTSP